MRSILVLACSLALAAGCARVKPTETAAAPPYNTDMPMNEVMFHVMNPAAFQFWSGWGVLEDEKGIHDLTPKTDAEWKVVEDGAATVAQMTNVIMMPGYARAPEAEWNRYAQGVAKLAMQGKLAAEKHDAKALGEIGEQLDVACDACHEKFPAPIQP
jgi:hypothetical protein